jgi:hypothetical protein
VQRITGVSLPSWKINSDLNLATSSAFATAPALKVLRRLIGPRPDDQTRAAQTAVASFTRYGFAAAAITAIAHVTARRRPPRERGIERVATLRFDHPYAAIAIAGRAPAATHPESTFTGLPLFSAWIDDPADVDDEPATAPRPAEP